MGREAWGMLGKGVVQACMMLGALTYRLVRCGSAHPRVGSMVGESHLWPSSTHCTTSGDKVRTYFSVQACRYRR